MNQSSTAAPSFFAQLDHLCVIRASGPDTESFLHGQLTNDLKTLSHGQLQLHGYCSPKGRVLALMHITLDADDFLLILPKATSESLLKRLRMFVMRAKVTLEIDEQVQVIGISDIGDYPANAPLPTLAISGDRAALILVPTAQFSEAENALSQGYEKGDAIHWAASRLLAGEPQIHPTTQDKFVPQMINLDLLDGLSFSKGCYPGQEIVARTRYLGKVKRRMQVFQAAADIEAAPGTPLYVDGKDQAAGELVEIIPAGQKASVASAVIRLEHAGCNLHLGSADGPLLQPLPLPYDLEAPEQ